MRATSLEAYHRIKSEGLLSQRRFEIYEIIAQEGPITIMHATEIFRRRHPRLQVSSVSPRFRELEEMGVIAEAYVGKCKNTGNSAIFWIVTDELPKKIEERVRQCYVVFPISTDQKARVFKSKKKAFEWKSRNQIKGVIHEAIWA